MPFAGRPQSAMPGSRRVPQRTALLHSKIVPYLEMHGVLPQARLDPSNSHRILELLFQPPANAGGDARTSLRREEATAIDHHAALSHFASTQANATVMLPASPVNARPMSRRRRLTQVYCTKARRPANGGKVGHQDGAVRVHKKPAPKSP